MCLPRLIEWIEGGFVGSNPLVSAQSDDSSTGVSVPTYRVAIVGAGPAGYFAAQALQNLQSAELAFAIDIFERLPTPWGLVRSGVAPDHPKIKTVSKVFEKIATQEGFRLLANVNVGVDVSLQELKDSYDAVVIAVGTPKGRSLGIPGENLSNVLSSAEFVYWYNGHPDYKGVEVNLSGKHAIVIGAGNVAMDVGRMLAIDPKELDPTDTAEHALSAFHASHVRDVTILARRGAEHAAFTSPELRELPDLESVNVIINKDEIEKAIVRAGSEPEKHVKSNLDAMLTIAESPREGAPRTLRFAFEHKPISINGDERVQSVTCETPEGQVELPCDLLISAIGYLPVNLPELEVTNNRYANTNGHIGENLYVVGWAKRGPSGVIGTNKSDATDVMKLLVSRLNSEKGGEDLLPLLIDRGVKVVSQNGWSLINDAEISKGVESGKPRVKFTDVSEMITIAGKD
jgi:ferredoxin/flavodoxin---NADP+ reductase